MVSLSAPQILVMVRVSTQGNVQSELTNFTIFPPVASISQVPSVESMQAAQAENNDDPYLAFM